MESRSLISLFGLITGLFTVPTLSLRLSVPEPTSTHQDTPDPQGWTPKETIFPAAKGYENLHGLRRRQLSLPKVTCGYISGDEDRPFGCVSEDWDCYWGTYPPRFGCCDPATADDYPCLTITGCFDYYERRSCTGTCTTSNLVCDSKYRYCETAISRKEISGDLFLLTSYQCEESEYYTSRYTIYKTTTTVPTVYDTITDFETETETLTNTNLTTPTTSFSPGPISSTRSTPPTPVPTPQPDDTGAIVGGVVGGVAGLALLGVGIWLLVRWYRTENGDNEPRANEIGGEWASASHPR